MVRKQFKWESDPTIYTILEFDKDKVTLEWKDESGLTGGTYPIHDFNIWLEDIIFLNKIYEVW